MTKRMMLWRTLLHAASLLKSVEEKKVSGLPSIVVVIRSSKLGSGSSRQNVLDQDREDRR